MTKTLKVKSRDEFIKDERRRKMQRKILIDVMEEGEKERKKGGVSD